MLEGGNDATKGPVNSMYPRPRLLAPAYLTAAVLGLVGHWYFVIAALPTERNYLGDFVSRTPSWGSRSRCC